MIRLSIIVPMYNVEPYVERCLHSLEKQDIQKNEFEIICINDGSPDDSKEVVKRLQKEYDNIILIDQQNQGVSRARNNGIDRAKGKYLLFIDPDDYVDSNSYGRILNKAEKYQAQVSFLGFTFLMQNGSIYRQVLNENLSSSLYNGIEAYYLARGYGQPDPDRMWAVLFERNFFNGNNLRYLPDVPYLEDGEFIGRILCLAERCIFDGSSFYQRTTRPGSATNSELFRSEKAINGFLLAAGNLKKFQEERDLNERQKIFLNQPICKFVLLALNSALQKPYLKNYKKIRKVLFGKGFKRIDLKGVDTPYTYFVRLYNSFMPVFLLSAFYRGVKEILKSMFTADRQGSQNL